MATHEPTTWGVHILNLPAQKSLLPEFKKPHRLRGHSNQMWWANLVWIMIWTSYDKIMRWRGAFKCYNLMIWVVLKVWCQRKKNESCTLDIHNNLVSVFTLKVVDRADSKGNINRTILTTWCQLMDMEKMGELKFMIVFHFFFIFLKFPMIKQNNNWVTELRRTVDNTLWVIYLNNPPPKKRRNKKLTILFPHWCYFYEPCHLFIKTISWIHNHC